MDQVVQLLGEDAQAPGTTDDHLMNSDEDARGGAGAVAGLQAQVEAMREDLENRFQQVEQRFKRKWLTISFEDPEMEEDFRSQSFNSQKAYMNAIVGLFCMYLSAAAIAYNAVPLARMSDQPAPNITCFVGLDTNIPVVEELVDGTTAIVTAAEHLELCAARGKSPYYSAEWVTSLLTRALVFRIVSILLSLMALVAIRCASRRVAIGAVVVIFWSSCIFFDLAFTYETIIEQVVQEHVLLPQPNPSLPPLLFIMLVYTVGIPAIPFTAACSCGWGVVVTSLISHFAVWGESDLLIDWAGIVWCGVDLSAGIKNPNNVHFALTKQLMRVVLFNIFGTFGTFAALYRGKLDRLFPLIVSSPVLPSALLRCPSPPLPLRLLDILAAVSCVPFREPSANRLVAVALEQTRQMRLNFCHARLLQEAVSLHKTCRLRFHKLTANTLPAPIISAIADGNWNFVKVYEHVTMLQADMVGFTPLSSKYPPERVLGILSDIFEEFDTLCENNEIDKVKTIGDAYIVCAGALRERRPDDAHRVVRMGMEMQEVVKRIAKKEGVDVAVRIGVHTGRCTGGIIGTVRFHFDMWGGAVYGSVKMEETGEKFRVHVSDSTYPLIRDRFECVQVTGVGCGKPIDEGARELGIHATYLIAEEKPWSRCKASAESEASVEASNRWSKASNTAKASRLLKMKKASHAAKLTPSPQNESPATRARKDSNFFVHGGPDTPTSTKTDHASPRGSRHSFSGPLADRISGVMDRISGKPRAKEHPTRESRRSSTTIAEHSSERPRELRISVSEGVEDEPGSPSSFVVTTDAGAPGPPSGPPPADTSLAAPVCSPCLVRTRSPTTRWPAEHTASRRTSSLACTCTRRCDDRRLRSR